MRPPSLNGWSGPCLATAQGWEVNQNANRTRGAAGMEPKSQLQPSFSSSSATQRIHSSTTYIVFFVVVFFAVVLRMSALEEG